MILQVWRYSHRYGEDVMLMLVHPNVKTVTQEMAISKLQIDWEGDVREDEFLIHEHSVDIGDNQKVAQLRLFLPVIYPEDIEIWREK